MVRKQQWPGRVSEMRTNVETVTVYYHPRGEFRWGVTALDRDSGEIVHSREFADVDTARSWAEQVPDEFGDAGASVMRSDTDPATW